MKKRLFSILFLTTSSLYASFYVQVMQTKYYEDILQEELNMNILGLHTKITKAKNNYFLYTGPYKKESKAKRVLSFTKEYYQNAHIIQRAKKRKMRVVSNIGTPVRKKQLKLTAVEEEKLRLKELQESKDANSTLKDEYYFAGVSFGYSYLSTTRDKDKSIEIHQPPSTMTYFKIEGGYIYDSFMTTLAYAKSTNSALDIYTIFTSANYIYNKESLFAPYAGLIMGYDFIKYRQNFLPNTPINKNKGYSFIMGAQVGVMMKLHKNISIYNAYKMTMSNNRIHINKADGRDTMLLYPFKYSAELGINFNF